MCNSKIYPLILVLLCGLLTADAGAQSFPNPSHSSPFKAEARTLSRSNNLPNIFARDEYLGLKISHSTLVDQLEAYHSIYSMRASLYPNTGYNLWLQLSQWSGHTPHFAVSTGIQIEYPKSNSFLRRAIGLGWTEVYAEIHTQRDIQIFGILGRSTDRFELGITGALTLHHILVDDGHGIPDYDETFLRFIPYIGMMTFSGQYFQILVPTDKQGAILNLAYEIHLGSRE